MPPKLRSSVEFGPFDLAILTDTGIREVAAKAKIEFTEKTSRSSLVASLRDAGLDKFHPLEDSTGRELLPTAIGTRLEALERAMEKICIGYYPSERVISPNLNPELR